jgi:hypothetical protein
MPLGEAGASPALITRSGTFLGALAHILIAAMHFTLRGKGDCTPRAALVGTRRLGL